MKKGKIKTKIITLMAFSLLVAGCGKEIEVKNGSKVAVSTKNEKFTATEYYQKIKEDNISKLVEMIDTSILEKKYKSDSKENEEITKQIDQIKSMYGSDDEESFNNILKSYFGAEDEKELETKLRLDYKRKKAVEDYVKKHLEKSEIESYYKDNIFGEVKASHILITVDTDESASDEDKENAEKEALNKAKEIIEKLNNGESFAKLAKKNSKDESTAVNGGDLGFFEVDDMTETFATAVKSLKVNEYTKEPIKTEFGFHIILKTEEKDKPKLKDVEDEIKETLRDQKLEDNNVLYYETLVKVREAAKIKWNDSTLKKAYEKYTQDLIDNAKKNN